MEFFSPYSMLVNLTTTTASGVTLVDSSGTALDCNYISIESSGAGNGWYRAAVDCGTASGAADPGVATAVQSLGIVTSAIPCQFAPNNKGICEFVLSDTDRTNLVTFQLSQAEDTTLIVTYGYIQFPGNSIRAFERSIGD